MQSFHKKVLLLGTPQTDLKRLYFLFESLNKKGVLFVYWGKNEQLLELFKKNNWPLINAPLPSPTAKLAMLAPFYTLTGLLTGSSAIKKSGITTIITLDEEVKPLAQKLQSLFKAKILWNEFPGSSLLTKKPKSYKKINRKDVQLIVWSHSDKQRLLQAEINRPIQIIHPGINTEERNDQDNLFRTLARAEHPRRKFFTIGTITNLDSHHLEPLLKAVQSSLEVVPNIQLVIVGGGKEKKSLMWLAKKMGIESAVWLVGEQAQPKKWLENLDLYIIPEEYPELKDLYFSLDVMLASLPIIGSQNSGLDDLVFEGKTGFLVKLANSESLAQAIINIEQDPDLREEIKKQAKERVKKYFTQDKTIEQFEKLL